MRKTLRSRRAIPYLLMAPGLLWLLLFFVVPNLQMLLFSLSEGTLRTGFTTPPQVWDWENFTGGIDQFSGNFRNSIVYGGLATILCFLIGYPLAYSIAFKGGRWKSLLLFMVIAPFFTSFLIRTISWKILLGDEGPLLGPLKHVLGIIPADTSLISTPIAVIAGLTYNFLPFMILPLYVALEKIDLRLIEAAYDLYASRWEAFRRVTLPLALPGVFAGTLLTFIPSMGDFVNAQLLGSPKTAMIGNVIQNQFLIQNDYPTAAALSFVLMIGILVTVLAYARFLGTEQLTG